MSYVSSLHVSGFQVPIIRRSLYLCDTGICHSGGVWSADRTPTIQNNKYQCRI